MPSDEGRRVASTRLSRRSLVAAALAACSRQESSSAAPPPVERPPVAPPSTAKPASPARLSAEEKTLDFPETRVGRMSAVVLIPERRPDERFPVLIAMHGRGETLKGPVRGARGWVDDYALGRAVERLRAPPLASRDFQGFVNASRLAALNHGLGETAYRGLVVVCPFTPDVLGREEPFSSAPLLAEFLLDALMPKVRAEAPALTDPAALGIDGVSLGGRAALAVGLSRPDAFGAVAGLQAAFDPENTSEIVERVRKARARNPGLRLRLVTSEGDYYRRVMAGFHTALDAAGLAHDYLVTPGPHDYAWNRGPGALEMLAYHDRVLRGLSPI